MHLIQYETAPCILGQMMVATTARGLCYVGFADKVSNLVASLTKRFPGIHKPGQAGINQIKQLLAGQDCGEIRQDLYGTDFQKRVWNEICKIPAGQIRFYGEIAEAIGQPTAARVVAQACGANPLALVIPCHRVVGIDGGGDYQWGLQRKVKLLALESSRATQTLAKDFGITLTPSRDKQHDRV